MAKPAKTQANDDSVDTYIAAVADPARRADCVALVALMQQASGEAPRMWGSSIVGFGRYHYRYASGHEGDACLVGFSSRKRDLTLYVMPGFAEYGALLARLGPHKTGRSCLYLSRLADIDTSVLAELVRLSLRDMRRRHGEGA